MTNIYNKIEQKEVRKLLRKEETRAEKIVWEELRNNKIGVKFRRQHGIGNYVADFCSPRNKLVIEIDGVIHDQKEQKIYDQEKEAAIRELGFKILRFKNEEVINNLSSVLSKINKFLILSPETRPHPPAPSPY